MKLTTTVLTSSLPPPTAKLAHTLQRSPGIMGLDFKRGLHLIIAASFLLLGGVLAGCNGIDFQPPTASATYALDEDAGTPGIDSLAHDEIVADDTTDIDSLAHDEIVADGDTSIDSLAHDEIVADDDTDIDSLAHDE